MTNAEPAIAADHTIEAKPPRQPVSAKADALCRAIALLKQARTIASDNAEPTNECKPGDRT
jgi:hypothetical protein